MIKMWEAIRQSKIDDFRESLIDDLEKAGRENLAKEVDEWDYEDVEAVAVLNSWLSSYAAREILKGGQQ